MEKIHHPNRANGSGAKVVSAVEPHSTTQVGGELIDIPMPKMGESIMEGTIIKWHKKTGDSVARDEIIFEMSTDKVDTEVPSPVDGTIAEILFGENDTVAVGVSVARVKTKSGLVKFKTEVKNVDEKENEKEEDNVYPAAVREDMALGDSNFFYSPLVLNIARIEGISMTELETIAGTGTGGRVTKNDLLKYVQSGKKSKNLSERLHGKKETSPSTAKTENVSSRSSQRTEIIPMDNIRQRIKDHMINSRNTSVHVTAVIEVDMTLIHNFIEKNRDAYISNEGIKLTYMPFISYAVVKGLKEFPLMNASIEGNNIVMKKYINLGIAVAVEPNGLIVPNIKNADEKNVRGLAKSIADIGNRSRTKKLVTDDVLDGTFTITNYGVFGSLFGTPIINQPEVGILGVGAVTKKPVVIENNGAESIAIKPMMYLSLSHDHRLVDGMLGGKFIKLVKDALENFDTSHV